MKEKFSKPLSCGLKATNPPKMDEQKLKPNQLPKDGLPFLVMAFVSERLSEAADL